MFFQEEHFYSLVLMFLLIPLTGKAYEDLTGKADEDHPHLGAAGVIANEYVPGAEDEGGEGEGEVEGEGEGEGEGDHHFPEGGTINSNPANIVDKALECFHDKYVSNSCLQPQSPSQRTYELRPDHL